MHKECSQLTAHKNKHAVINGKELCTYYHGSSVVAVVADCVYATMQLLKQNAVSVTSV